MIAAAAMPQVARERELEPAADRVAVERRERRIRIGLDRVDRRGERMRDELLRLVGEHRLGKVADVVAGGEDAVLAGDRSRSARRAGQRLRERVEDRWSSAPRLPGLEIVSRATPGAGSSTSSRLSRRPRLSVEDNERVALGDGLTLLAPGSPSPRRDPRPRPASPSSSTRGSRPCRPPATESPTATSIFQTVPVMWASTSDNVRFPLLDGSQSVHGSDRPHATARRPPSPHRAVRLCSSQARRATCPGRVIGLQLTDSCKTFVPAIGLVSLAFTGRL